MSDARRAVQPEVILPQIFDRAVARGERSVAIVRLVVLGLVFVQLLVMYGPERWLSGEPRPWVALGFVVLGGVGSALILRRLRGAETAGRLPWLSVALDALVVFGIGFPGAFWPREGYPGQLHFHTFPFFLLAIAGAGLRISRPVVRFATAMNVAGALGLLAVDAWTGAQVVPNDSADWILWGVAFVGASFFGDAVAERSRTLAFDAARAVLDAERARLTLGVYVSEEVAELALTGEAPAPGGRRQLAAVLFSDLRGFTTYAERLPPERLVSELNAYLADMVRVVRAEGGVVDKYIGDAIMVVFGVPREDPSAAARAIRTARAMDEALVAHNAGRAARGLPPLKHGIGVHFGEVIVGNIGTAERMQYTVVGDTVNLASRLESATKELGATVLVSEAAVEAARGAGLEVPTLTERGTIPIRGRAEGVRVYA